MLTVPITLKTISSLWGIRRPGRLAEQFRSMQAATGQRLWIGREQNSRMSVKPKRAFSPLRSKVIAGLGGADAEKPRKIQMVHGEPKAQRALAAKLVKKGNDAEQ